MGIEADSHRWQMESARILKYVLEAGAFRKINLILTVPYFSMIIRQGRGLAHFLILMIRQGYGWLYVLDADYYRDKLYHWWWHSIHFPLPPEHIIIDYEQKKARYWAKKVDEWVGVKYINKGKRTLTSNRPTCPNCNSRQAYYRITTKDWLCRICGHSFEWVKK